MMFRPRRDLGEVGDGEHLVRPPGLLQPRADRVGDLAPDPGVDLVEYQRRHPVRGAQDRLEGEHHPRQLPAAGDPAEGRGRKPGVQRSQELHPLCAPRPDLGQRAERDREGASFEPKLREQRCNPLLKYARCLTSRLAERRRLPLQAGPCLPDAPLQGGDVERARLDLLELSPQPAPCLDHVLERGSVLALQPEDAVQAGPDLLQPTRIMFQGACVVPEEAARLAGRLVGLLQQLRDLAQRAVQADDVRERPLHRANSHRDGGVTRVELLVGAPRGARQLVGVFEPGRLRLERRVLPLPEPGAFDLAELEADEVRTRLEFPDPRFQLLPLARQRLQLSAQRGDGARPSGRARQGIQQPGLFRGPEQALVLMLSVQVDQVAPQLPQQPHRGGRVVHPGPVAPLARDFPPEHQHVAARGQTQRVQLLPHRRALPDIERRLDPGAAGAHADHPGRSPFAQQARKGVRHERLAGPGLARQGVEARRPVQRQVIDDRVVAYTQFDQHVRRYS